MANDIARQFGYLSQDEAATAVAGHIAMFWDPRMRRQLADEVDHDPGRLDPAVVRAVTGSA
jgi:formate dehydrogenase subunit delta